MSLSIFPSISAIWSFISCFCFLSCSTRSVFHSHFAFIISLSISLSLCSNSVFLSCSLVILLSVSAVAFSDWRRLIAAFHNVSTIDLSHFSFESSSWNVLLNSFFAFSRIFLINIIFWFVFSLSICFSVFTFSPGLGSGCCCNIFAWSHSMSISLSHLASSSVYDLILFRKADLYMSFFILSLISHFVFATSFIHNMKTSHPAASLNFS